MLGHGVLRGAHPPPLPRGLTAHRQTDPSAQPADPRRPLHAPGYDRVLRPGHRPLRPSHPGHLCSVNAAGFSSDTPDGRTGSFHLL